MLCKYEQVTDEVRISRLPEGIAGLIIEWAPDYSEVLGKIVKRTGPCLSRRDGPSGNLYWDLRILPFETESKNRFLVRIKQD